MKTLTKPVTRAIVDDFADEITLARAFRSNEPNLWAQVSRQVVQQLIIGLILWGRNDNHNQQVATPTASSLTAEVVQ